MKVVELQTGWIGDGGAHPAVWYVPAILLHHPPDRYEDVSGSHPREGGAFVAECSYDDDALSKAEPKTAAQKIADLKSDLKYAGKVHDKKEK